MAYMSIIGSVLGSAASSSGDSEGVSLSPGLSLPSAAGGVSYEGQRDISKQLSSFLWENLDKGLTEEEKTRFRSKGRTSILDAIKGTKRAQCKEQSFIYLDAEK